MTYRAEVLSVETLGDKIRVPTHQAKAYWTGRIVRVSLEPR